MINGKSAGKVVAVERLPCVRINVPELFADPEFADWVRDGQAATWHGHLHAMGEYSDVFVTYDGGSGSDAESMPEHCWEYIKRAVEPTRIAFGVVWLTNLDS